MEFYAVASRVGVTYPEGIVRIVVDTCKGVFFKGIDDGLLFNFCGGIFYGEAEDTTVVFVLEV